MKKTQWQAVIEYIKEHGSLTRAEAMDVLHIGNLTAVMSVIRQRGYKIKTTEVPCETPYGKTTYARYTLEEQ